MKTVTIKFALRARYVSTRDLYAACVSEIVNLTTKPHKIVSVEHDRNIATVVFTID